MHLLYGMLLAVTGGMSIIMPQGWAAIKESKLIVSPVTFMVVDVSADAKDITYNMFNNKWKQVQCKSEARTVQGTWKESIENLRGVKSINNCM